MKSGTLGHIKTRRLMRILGIPLYQAAGILETLWQTTAESADDGSIGRYSNADIADSIGWQGDPDRLISALIEAGWLDEDEDDRPMVHDWEDHAPDYIKERLRKRGWRAKRRKLRTCDDKTRDTNGTTAGLSQDCPAPVPPCPVLVPSLPNPTQPSTRSARIKGSTKAPRLRVAKADQARWDGIRSSLVKRVPFPPRDSHLPGMVAVLVCADVVSERLAVDAAEGVCRVRPPPDNPSAYFWRSLANSLPDVDLSAAMRRVDLPRPAHAKAGDVAALLKSIAANFEVPDDCRCSPP